MMCFFSEIEVLFNKKCKIKTLLQYTLQQGFYLILRKFVC